MLILCALHSFAFAIFHIFFWKIFKWKKELRTSTALTRAIIQILNLRLIYVFLGVGFVCLRFPEELQTTALGKTFLVGMSLFWVGRLLEQFVFLPINRASVHLLSALFLLGAILFALPLML